VCVVVVVVARTRARDPHGCARGVAAERYAQIEHDNRILLSKMSDIMQGKNTLDNECESAKYTHSLNREARRRELQRITAENQVRRRVMMTALTPLLA
jgi:hypothetical protein